MPSAAIITSLKQRAREFAFPLAAMALFLVAGLVTRAMIAHRAKPAGAAAVDLMAFEPRVNPGTPGSPGILELPGSDLFAPNQPAAAPAPPAAQAPADSAADTFAIFDGRRIRKVRSLTMTCTAYNPDEQSCGKWAAYHTTASGKSIWTNGMKLVAADTRLLPFGSIVSIPGYNNGRPVPVLDRGGAIKGNRLDVLFPTRPLALRWGRQTLEVDVWEYVD